MDLTDTITQKSRMDTPVFDPHICSVCGEPTKQVISEAYARIFRGMTVGDVIDHDCRCQREAKEIDLQRAKQEDVTKHRIQALRDRGIADALTASMTFDADCGYNPSICEKARRYVQEWDRVKAANIGLLFTGGVGTGKTFYAACIANALIDRGVFALMTSLNRIIRTPFDQYEYVLRSLEEADLVVFDDIGAERDTSFAWERAFDAVDTRIRTQKPIIVTTNLTPAELNQAKDRREQRIYDRILGACAIVPVLGESIRKREQRQRAETFASLLK